MDGVGIAQLLRAMSVFELAVRLVPSATSKHAYIADVERTIGLGPCSYLILQACRQLFGCEMECGVRIVLRERREIPVYVPLRRCELT